MLVINILQGLLGRGPIFLNLHQLYGLYRIKTLYLPFFTKFLCDLGKLKQIWSKSALLAVPKKQPNRNFCGKAVSSD